MSTGVRSSSPAPGVLSRGAVSLGALLLLALPAHAAPGDPPPRTLVIDLSGFTPGGVGGEVIGASAEQGEIVHARLDVTFVSSQTDPWTVGGSFNLPVDGVGAAIGFSSDLLGWSGMGTFTTVVEGDSMDGLLQLPKGQNFYTWFFGYTSAAPFELPGGGVGLGPVNGFFEELTLTLTFAPCPFGDPTAPWEDVGLGLAGTHGLPTLAVEGSLCDDEPGTLNIGNSLRGGVVILIVGLSRIDAPLEGGTLVPSPDVLIVGLPLDAVGEHELPFTFPATVPSGLEFWLQGWIPDPDGPSGLAATNGVKATVP